MVSHVIRLGPDRRGKVCKWVGIKQISLLLGLLSTMKTVLMVMQDKRACLRSSTDDSALGSLNPSN
jgi:hypothetical protein